MDCLPSGSHQVVTYSVQALASGLSLWSIYLMGNKSIKGPVVGLLSQVFWIGHVVLTPAWGIAPVPLALTAVHVRNLRKWLRERGANHGEAQGAGTGHQEAQPPRDA